MLQLFKKNKDHILSAVTNINLHTIELVTDQFHYSLVDSKVHQKVVYMYAWYMCREWTAIF